MVERAKREIESQKFIDYWEGFGNIKAELEKSGELEKLLQKNKC